MGVGTGLYMYDVIETKFTFAISSPDEFLYKPSKHLGPAVTLQLSYISLKRLHGAHDKIRLMQLVGFTGSVLSASARCYHFF